MSVSEFLINMCEALARVTSVITPLYSELE